MESRSYNELLCALCAIVSLCMLGLSLVEGGCMDSKLCCTGRDNNCKTQGYRELRADQNGTDQSKLMEKLKKTLTVCYCDEHCSAQNDCCDDYKKHCPADDCKLGEWQEWGKCSERCGVGMRERTRPILSHPKNGGKLCDSTLQKGRCESNKCKVARHSHGFEIRETAKLVPATFGTWRRNKRYNPYKDIRKNLFRHYSSNKIIQRPPYCAKYELVKVGRACHSKAAKTWVKVMKPGTTVCVECQSFAMKRKLGVRCRGHGVYLKETSWNALSSPGCHGTWVMQTHHEPCSCDSESQHSFILI